MFKVGDIVEITAEAAATGMLDFTQDWAYRVHETRLSEYGVHLQVFMLNDSGVTGWYHQNHFKLKEDTIVEKEECLFKEGQVVWDVVYGKGVVVEIAEYSVYPVVVQFSDETMAYSEDGKTYETHGRTLFFSEPKIEAATEPLFEPTLKGGEVVVAVDKDGCSEILYVSEEFERQVKNTQGTLFYKEAFDFYKVGEKINFK